MYNVESFRWLMDAVEDLRGKRICEMGNQRICDYAAPVIGTTHKLARHWMLDEGVEEYVSIDTNGQDGALEIDLGKPVPFALRGRFDIVTNIGTSEHVVGPPPHTRNSILKAQTECFKNAFRLCRDGGLMINHVPPVHSWREHSCVHYKFGLANALSRSFRSVVMLNELVRLTTINAAGYLLIFVLRKVASDLSCIHEGEIAAEIEVDATYERKVLP